MNYVKQKTIDDDRLPEFKIGKSVYKGRPPHYQMVGFQWVKVYKGVPYVKVRDNE